jgi:hypothetical protein
MPGLFSSDASVLGTVRLYVLRFARNVGLFAFECVLYLSRRSRRWLLYQITSA